MSDEPDNPVLRCLRQIDSKLDQLVADIAPASSGVKGEHRQDGALKIEVTPQMTRAGVVALERFSGSYDAEGIVEEVYKAMAATGADNGGDHRQDPTEPDNRQTSIMAYANAVARKVVAGLASRRGWIGYDEALALLEAENIEITPEMTAAGNLSWGLTYDFGPDGCLASDEVLTSGYIAMRLALFLERHREATEGQDETGHENDGRS